MYIAILLLHNIFSTVNKLLLFFFTLLFPHIYSTVNFDWICNFPTILILQSLVEITHKNGDETWWIHLHVCYGNSHNQRSTYCSKSSTVVSHKPLRGFIASHSFLFFFAAYRFKRNHWRPSTKLLNEKNKTKQMNGPMLWSRIWQMALFRASEERRQKCGPA